MFTGVGRYILTCQQENIHEQENIHDPYIVAVMNNGAIVYVLQRFVQGL